MSRPRTGTYASWLAGAQFFLTDEEIAIETQNWEPEIWTYDEEVNTQAKRTECQENSMQDSPSFQSLATRRLLQERAAQKAAKEAAEAKAAAAKLESKALQDEADIVAKLGGLDLISTSPLPATVQNNGARTFDATQGEDLEAKQVDDLNNSVDPSPSRYVPPTVEADQEGDSQRNEDMLPFSDNRTAITQGYSRAWPIFRGPHTRDFAYPSNVSRLGSSSNHAPHVKSVIKSFQATIKNAGFTKRSSAREKKASYNTSRNRQLHAGFGVFSDHAKTKDSEEAANGVIHEDADDDMMDIDEEHDYSGYFGGNMPFSKG